MNRTYYTYILLCSDKSYYTGVTNDVVLRFDEHCNGDDSRSYTYSRRPLKLVYYEEFDYVLDAIDREKQIKGWTRAKKKALIKGNEKLLVKLSKNRTNKK
jgi:putative endonuclease